jgi:hypothetical protein
MKIYSNTAIGTLTLRSGKTQSNLVAIGDSALYNSGLNVTDVSHSAGNIAVGSKSLFANTTGSYNSATGYKSLYSEITKHLRYEKT